jgi:hypothetical protein
MSVISVQITESKEGIIVGIPKYVKITANIPCIIFYTLDGTDPTLYSEQYIDTLLLPTNKTTVTLKVLASNGIDSSPILTETYSAENGDNVRNIRSTNSQAVGTELPYMTFPFGSGVQPHTSVIIPEGGSGLNISDPSQPLVSTGFDNDGNPSGFTNNNYIESNNKIYTISDRQNKPLLPNVGTLPGTVTYIKDPPAVEETFYSKMLFNPKSMVIYHNVEDQNPEDPPLIHTTNFSIPPIVNKTKSPRNDYFIASKDTTSPTGSLVRQFYNSKDNTYTHYYFDSRSLRWIISKYNYTPSENSGHLENVIFSRAPNSCGFVFKWYPGMRRYLF